MRLGNASPRTSGTRAVGHVGAKAACRKSGPASRSSPANDELESNLEVPKALGGTRGVAVSGQTRTVQSEGGSRNDDPGCTVDSGRRARVREPVSRRFASTRHPVREEAGPFMYGESA